MTRPPFYFSLAKDEERVRERKVVDRNVGHTNRRGPLRRIRKAHHAYDAYEAHTYYVVCALSYCTPLVLLTPSLGSLYTSTVHAHVY